MVEGPRWLLGRAVWGTAGDLGFTRDGTHAEYLRFPAAGLAPRPVTLSAEQAAAVPVTFVTAWMGLIEAADVRDGETVVVFGASGGVGSAVTQLAHWRGARVIGVDYVLPPDDVDASARPDRFVGTAGPELVEAVREATGGRGADVGFDAVGGSDFESHLGAVARGGRLAVIASVGERRVSFDLIDFYRRQLRLFGIDSRKVDALGAVTILERLELGFLTGALTPPRIAARFPLARAREAYEVVGRGDAQGRVVLIPSRRNHGNGARAGGVRLRGWITSRVGLEDDPRGNSEEDLVPGPVSRRERGARLTLPPLGYYVIQRSRSRDPLPDQGSSGVQAPPSRTRQLGAEGWESWFTRRVIWCRTRGSLRHSKDRVRYSWPSRSGSGS